MGSGFCPVLWQKSCSPLILQARTEKVHWVSELEYDIKDAIALVKLSLTPKEDSWIGDRRYAYTSMPTNFQVGALTQKLAQKLLKSDVSKDIY